MKHRYPRTLNYLTKLLLPGRARLRNWRATLATSIIVAIAVPVAVVAVIGVLVKLRR